MPGLPKNLLSTYQKYKNHTDSIAQWLASTAKKHGYISPKAKKGKKNGSISQAGATYTVATKEWTALATFIAGLTEPSVEVPVKLASLLDTTIDLRESYSSDLSDILDDTDSKRDSDVSHAFFLDVLKKVRAILTPRLPKDHALSKKPKTTAEIINMFEHLDLEEPSEAFEAASDVPAVVPTNEPIYKAERQNDLEESFFAFYLLLHDLSRLRIEVSRAWDGYKQGMHDLVAASITTNTAVDLARSMSEDLKSTFATHGGATKMLQIYYAAQCVMSGTSPTHKARPGDDMNFATYEVADALFYPALQLLNAFCNVLKVNPDPQMKRGIYGTYIPESKRANKSNREKFIEDKILLLEELEEIYFYCKTTDPLTSRPPVEDEFIRGLRSMFKTKEVTLALAFAGTLYFDIHHLLREDVDYGFQRLSAATHFIQGNIEEEQKFHAGINMDTWPESNDKAVQQFVDTLHFWCHEDQQLILARKLKRVNLPEAFHLYRKHPWMCGMWKYFAQMRFHEISVVFVNAWGSVMSCAHLYNAVQEGKTQKITWKDMDVMIALQDPKTLFIGEPPTAADDCLKRFALALGASAANLAKSTRKKKGLTLSKRGPKGLKELGPILQTFKGRFCDGNGQNDIRSEDVQNILLHAGWNYALDENGRPAEVYKDTDEAPMRKPVTHLPVAKLVGLLGDLLHAEMIEIQYDYFRLHRQCWRLLRFLKDRCREDFIKMYGPDYIEKESQLPFIVGYVLMSATSGQQVGDMLKARLPGVEVTGKVMSDAKDVVIGMVETGAGALIVEQILPKGLGVEIEFEIEQ